MNLFKKACLVGISVASFQSIAQSYPHYEDIPGTVKTGMNSIVQFLPGDDTSGENSIPENALGYPDGADASGVTSLGLSGSIIGSFKPYVLKGDGTNAAELYVYEWGWFDNFEVYISKDETNWIKLTEVSEGKNSPHQDGRGSWVGYDVDTTGGSVDLYPFVKVVDLGTQKSNPPGSSGADIDSVVITNGQFIGGGLIVDTDSRNGQVFNLELAKGSGAVGVNVINKDNTEKYIPFTTDDSIIPVALSVQGNFDCNDEKDINVLATRKSDGMQLNIIKDQNGVDIRTIYNSSIK